MKKFLYWIIIVCLLVTAGCTGRQYNTQRGAMIGGLLGAGFGQAIGQDTESTLLGTALGGLVGSVIGNYEDQRIERQQHHYIQGNQSQGHFTYEYNPPPTYHRSPYFDHKLEFLITVPGQIIGNYFVPPHQVWVPRKRPEVRVYR